MAEKGQKAEKFVYAFGGGTAEGKGDQKALLGGKGAGLAEMSRLGIPVPPGFTITTAVCTWFQDHDGRYPATLDCEVERQLRRLEERTRQGFGNPANPLLVSVRSGAPVSMPGMMDTVLNLGLTPAIVKAWIARGADARFVLDAWRRLLTMYGNVVLGVEHGRFEEVLGAARSEQGAASDADLTPQALEAVAERFSGLIAEHGTPFPEDPRQQLWGAIGAVFSSWRSRRAREYRRLNDISDQLGTAVNVQAMVFGNRGSDCATGVAFTRNPATGEARVYGEFLVNAQGEDVVAGIRTPRPIVGEGGARGLAEDFPQADRELREVCARLEKHYRDMQDVEFTIQHDRLYMLQTRGGQRTGPAAVRIAAELVAEGVLTPVEALQRVKPQDLVQVLAPEFDVEEKARAVAKGRLLAHGLPAGPGAASGRMVLSADRAAEMAAHGPVILVRAETSPEDIVGMHAAAGILTSRGGMTSHAAVVARGMGKPCLVGAGALDVDEHAGVVRVGGKVVKEDDEISIDGTTGEVISGGLKTRPSEVLRTLLATGKGGDVSAAVASFRRVLEFADAVRRLRVRANADTPHDARTARALGAEGIGLCRTEHMFFAEDRIPWVRRMILAESDGERAEALARLLPMQQEDFEGIFQALAGLPVTVRLLDPPLHEFLPHGEALNSLAAQMGLPAEQVAARAAALSEANPMLGHRGSRLGMTAPEIYEMQVEAIARAAAVRAKAGDHVEAEIMVPLVGVEQEMIRLRERIAATLAKVFAEQGAELPVLIGTMIEVPRAALIAGQIAAHADFFSFGTNDLTQMTYGYSRDDIGRFLPQYIESGVLPHDPFASLDEEGVGQLVRLACERGRAVRGDLHLGICGEHGGDPDSIDFFERVGLDYVSCSPYRVPVARLAAARAALKHGSSAAVGSGHGHTAAGRRGAAVQAAGAAAASRRAAKPKTENPKAAKPAEKPKVAKAGSAKAAAVIGAARAAHGAAGRSAAAQPGGAAGRGAGRAAAARSAKPGTARTASGRPAGAQPVRAAGRGTASAAAAKPAKVRPSRRAGSAGPRKAAGTARASAGGSAAGGAGRAPAVRGRAATATTTRAAGGARRPGAAAASGATAVRGAAAAGRGLNAASRSAAARASSAERRAGGMGGLVAAGRAIATKPRSAGAGRAAALPRGGRNAGSAAAPPRATGRGGASAPAKSGRTPAAGGKGPSTGRSAAAAASTSPARRGALGRAAAKPSLRAAATPPAKGPAGRGAGRSGGSGGSRQGAAARRPSGSGRPAGRTRRG